MVCMQVGRLVERSVLIDDDVQEMKKPKLVLKRTNCSPVRMHTVMVD